MPGPAASVWTCVVYGAQHSLTLVLRNNLNQISLWWIPSISVSTGGHCEADLMLFLKRLQTFSTLHSFNSSNWLKSGVCSKQKQCCMLPLSPPFMYVKDFSLLLLNETQNACSPGKCWWSENGKTRESAHPDDSIWALHLAASEVKSKPGLLRFVIFLFKRICVGAFYLQLKKNP